MPQQKRNLIVKQKPERPAQSLQIQNRKVDSLSRQEHEQEFPHEDRHVEQDKQHLWMIV